MHAVPRPYTASALGRRTSHRCSALGARGTSATASTASSSARRSPWRASRSPWHTFCRSRPTRCVGRLPRRSPGRVPPGSLTHTGGGPCRHREGPGRRRLHRPGARGPVRRKEHGGPPPVGVRAGAAGHARGPQRRCAGVHRARPPHLGGRHRPTIRSTIRRRASLVSSMCATCAAGGPGCSSTHTHRDHLEPYRAGPASAANLGRLSPRCHQAKHAGSTLVRHPTPARPDQPCSPHLRPSLTGRRAPARRAPIRPTSTAPSHVHGRRAAAGLGARAVTAPRRPPRRRPRRPPPF